MIADWTRSHDKQEAMRLIGAAGVPAGAVFDTMELMNDPSLRASAASCRSMEHPTRDRSRCRAWPVRFDGTPPKLEPSPLLGQHTAEVLGDWLGMSKGDVEALKKDGAI